MIIKTIKPSYLALAVSLSVSHFANAATDRFIIQVDNENQQAVRALAKQHGGNVELASNDFIAVTFAGKSLPQVKGLMNNPHIKLIEVDAIRKPLSTFSDSPGNPNQQQVTPYAVPQAQADQLNLQASSGIKVCIIDSGLDASNSDFEWDNITGDDDPGTGSWDTHGGPHGTHVAGTIGAANNDIGVVGMAPGVAMHIIKVFNESGWGYSSDLAHAANLCAQAGANIINMSLGGAFASSTEENAFNSFQAAGGLAIAAAGNDGNTDRSYPAGYSSVMMVGANDANNQIADFSQHPSCESGRGKRAKFDETICVEVTAGGVDTLSTYPAGMASLSVLSSDTNSFASSAMENTGNANAETYDLGLGEQVDTNAAGKICIIDRGNISFHDKVLNCELSGGVGAVIINNVSGMLYGTLSEPNQTTIPAVGASFEDSAAIRASATLDISVGSSDYGFMSGTSMATPAVSGVAALVWSNNTLCSGEEIREALKQTALDSGAAGHDVFFGHGIVQAKAASDYLSGNCTGGDNGGGDNGGGDNPPPADIELNATGYKSKGEKYVDLTWTGSSSEVDVYRDATVIATLSNSSYTDFIDSKGGGTYVYQVCEANSTAVCSASISVSF